MNSIDVDDDHHHVLILSNVYHGDLVVSTIEIVIVNLYYVDVGIPDYAIDFLNNDVCYIDRHNDDYCTNLGNLDDGVMANDGVMEQVVHLDFSVVPNLIRHVNRQQLFHQLLSKLVLHQLDVEN